MAYLQTPLGKVKSVFLFTAIHWLCKIFPYWIGVVVFARIIMIFSESMAMIFMYIATPIFAFYGVRAFLGLMVYGSETKRRILEAESN